MDTVLAAILLIILSPVLLCALVQAFAMLTQMTVGAIFITLPWLLLFLVLVALGAGIGAGLTLRDRFPPRTTGELPPPPGTVTPVRRARQVVSEDDDEGGLR